MKTAFLHVSVPFAVCVALTNTSLFDAVHVDLTHEHYAEKPVDSLPFFLAMPFNCGINVAYALMGLYWLLVHAHAGDSADDTYMRHVFALMAVLYAPVQWARLALLARGPALLDQWVTLPIFAWVPVWIGFIQDKSHRKKTSKKHALVLELCSLSSYGLALKFEHGFDVALACHVLLAVVMGTQVQRRLGNRQTLGYLVLAVVCCGGFVALKLLDHWLARFWVFQRATGHFWSKVCDVLQFHYSFCFLTTLTRITHKAHD